MIAHHHRTVLNVICNQFRSISSRSPSSSSVVRQIYDRSTIRGYATEGLTATQSAMQNIASGGAEEEFRTLDIIKSKERKRYPARKEREKPKVLPPRYKTMPVDQDWPSVWPTARSFHPASVPLPLHQGYVDPHLAPPNKWANAELMKVVNFLHLTPPAIKRQCEAIKKFCTPWPAELQDEETIDDYFPVEILTTDYCHSSPIINDNRARIVTLKVRLSYLDLDEHASDKFRRLIGDRYDLKTDIVTIVCQYCPLRSQNFEHVMYLLTALYHESWKIDSWEAEKLEEDMEKYVWEGSPSHATLTEILTKVAANASSKMKYLEPLEGKIVSQENIVVVDPVQQYRTATLKIHNKGESVESMEEYGKSVRSLFNLNPK